jgi:hypothetical protein
VRKAPKALSHIPNTNDTWDWEPSIHNDTDSLAREVFETPEETYNTGLLDVRGDPIVMVTTRNPIGFRAEIEE